MYRIHCDWIFNERGTKIDITFEMGQATFNYRVVGIIIKDNHVLIHRSFSDSKWDFPGCVYKLVKIQLIV